MTALRKALLVTSIVCAVAAHGGVLEPVAVAEVADGDSVWLVRTNDCRSVLFHLDGIDAPELGQPYGRAARGHLLALLASGECFVEADTIRQGSDGQHGNLILDGRKCVSNVMLEDGAVWCVVEPSGECDVFKFGLQEEAKRQRRGLWRCDVPVAPNDWRSKHAVSSTREYGSFDEAMQDILPNDAGDMVRKTKWLEHSKPLTSEKRPQRRPLGAYPCGDYRVVNIFRYYDRDVGGMILCCGLLVSVKIGISYSHNAKPPTEDACLRSVKGLFESGGVNPNGERTRPIRTTARERFKAVEARADYSGDEEGLLYVFLRRCRLYDGNPLLGPATPAGTPPKRETRKLNLKQPINEDIRKQNRIERY